MVIRSEVVEVVPISKTRTAVTFITPAGHATISMTADEAKDLEIERGKILNITITAPYVNE